MRDPGQPTQREWEEHRIDHWPFRSWCPHCVKGRATGKQHNRRSEESEIPVFGFDYLHTNEAKELEGVVLVFDPKFSGDARAALTDFAPATVDRHGETGWRLRFASHDEAERALKAVGEWAKAHDGWAAMGFNDRAYTDRGWCVLEDRVTREAVGRSRQPGFEEIKELMDAAPLGKVYVISDETLAAVIRYMDLLTHLTHRLPPRPAEGPRPRRRRRR